MKRTIVIGFSVAWGELLHHLPKEVATQLKKCADIDCFGVSVTLDSKDGLSATILGNNRVVGGKSLVRAVREIVRLERTDIEDEGVYVLLLGTKEREPKVHGQPIDYYRQELECEHCGRWSWVQARDLDIHGKLAADIDMSNCGEVVVSRRLKHILEEGMLKGLSFRTVGGSEGEIWQIIIEGRATMRYPDEFIVELDHCRVCGKPRRVLLEDSNGVSWVGPQDRPRIDRTPTVHLKMMEGDFARTDREFGTLGERPEGASCVAPEEFPYRMSHPELVVSGRFCRVLYEEGVDGFEIAPAEIV